MSYCARYSSCVLVATVFFGPLPATWAQQDPSRQAPAPRTPLRVGQIWIIGNETVSHGIVLRTVQLFPGHVLVPRDLRESQRLLMRQGIFDKVTVSALSEDSSFGSPYRDIRIEVVERRWTRHLQPYWDLIDLAWDCEDADVFTALELLFGPECLSRSLRLRLAYEVASEAIQGLASMTIKSDTK